MRLPSDTNWPALNTAYGKADDIPTVLKRVAAAPDGDNELAWFNLWSALAHQGDCFDASYATVPILVAVYRSTSVEPNPNFLLLAVAIELARHQGRGPDMPADLAVAYFDAIRSLGECVAARMAAHWSDIDIRANLAAIAVSKGNHGLAEAVLRLDEDTVVQFNAQDD